MSTEIIKAQDRPALSMNETGYLGLKIFNGVSNDELKRELNFPQSIKTFKEMTYHGTVAASLSMYDTIISRATWSFKPPEDATKQELKQCRIVQEMMGDMDQSWGEFIRDVLSMNTFGFSVHEKVFRKRTFEDGSMYNDGYIGWKKLPIRAQESIEKFLFSDDGNEITGVKQNLTNLMDPYNRYKGRTTSEIILPREKFLHFRAGKHRGDPFGKSPLRDAYIAWRFITNLEELEATGVSKDLVGLPILYLPAQYMSKEATPDQVVIRSYYENAMRNLQQNQQSALILPNAYDPDTKQPLFKLDLLSVDGKKNFDITKIKEYYKNLIMTALSSEILIMGQSEVGSFALGSIKNSMSGAMAASMLKSIAEVIDRDLIRHTYKVNKWDISRRGTLDFDNLSEVDLESISKYFQRVASVGLLEVDREALNTVRTAIGMDALPEELAPQKDILSGNASKAGEGMKTAGEGTSKDPSGEDTSSNNLDNAA